MSAISLLSKSLLIYALAGADLGGDTAYHSRIDGLVLSVEVTP